MTIMKERTEILPDFLEGMALTWHEALPEETKSDWGSLIGVMKDRFGTMSCQISYYYSWTRFLKRKESKF